MRLSDLTPETVAADVVAVVQQFAASLSMRVNLGPPPLDWDCESLRLSALDLAAFAINGAALDAHPIDYVQTLAEALFIRPADQGTYETGDLFGEADQSTSWGLVIRAALARQSVLDGEDQSPAGLALLASITPDGVRKLIAAGEIRARKHRDDSQPGKPASAITASEAKRWLSGRGVAGF